jgi:hypothetical protein
MSSTMWVVEDEAVVAGGLLRTMRSFALMNLVSKRYLVASRDSVDPACHRAAAGTPTTRAREDRFAAVGLESASTPAAGLLLQSLEGVSANACVAWGGRFHILSAETGRYLHAADAARLAHPPNAGPRPGDRVMVASPAMFREDSFEIQRVPDEQVTPCPATSLFFFPQENQHKCPVPNPHTSLFFSRDCSPTAKSALWAALTRHQDTDADTPVPHCPDSHLCWTDWPTS